MRCDDVIIADEALGYVPGLDESEGSIPVSAFPVVDESKGYVLGRSEGTKTRVPHSCEREAFEAKGSVPGLDESKGSVPGLDESQGSVLGR